MSQTVSGVPIGGDASTLTSLAARPDTTQNIGPFTIARYSLESGNAVSATYNNEDGRIHYLEIDWGGSADTAKSDFEGFIYGTTTLEDIRNRFGSNGIQFKDGVVTSDAKDGGILVYNSYELKDTDDIVVLSPKFRLRVFPHYRTTRMRKTFQRRSERRPH